MGYSLYITRREDWSDPDGPAIALSEWISLVESDPELHWEPALGLHFAVWGDLPGADAPWLAWENGDLESKHPEKGMIRKMHVIAELLSAQLMGEEGEGYDSNGDEIPRSIYPGPPAPLSLWQRIRAFFGRRLATDPGYPIGCRVQDAFGRVGTVVNVDLRAENGLGSIVVRYDDGHTAGFATIAHGLERLNQAEGGI